MDKLQEEIMLGAVVCRMLKAIFWPDESWAQCSRKISVSLGRLKCAAAKFHGESDMDFILRQLAGYPPDDIREMLGGNGND